VDIQKIAAVVLIFVVIEMPISQAKSLKDYTKLYKIKVEKILEKDPRKDSDSTDQKKLMVSDHLIDLSHKSLTDIKGIAQLKVMLDGRDILLNQVPNLHLFLRDNHLKEIPPEIGKLRNLEWLNLEGNLIERLPRDIGELNKLQGLYLAKNRLKFLPSTVGNLKALKKLDISVNRLEILPETLGQLKNLNYLNVSKNELRTLPKTLPQLTKLVDLDLSQNQLIRLPDEISRLPVERLTVADNQLKSLPSTIGHMKCLSFDASRNQLKALPPEMANMSKVQDLYLNHNELTIVPEFIDQMATLKEIQLYGNPLIGDARDQYHLHE
jgi:Leucine-rich repeat (LRR) protein